MFVSLTSIFGHVFASSIGGGNYIQDAMSQVTIDFNNEKQEIDGFGASNAWVTGAVKNKLSVEEQKEILDALFSTTSGAGLSIVRNRGPFDLLSEEGSYSWNNWDISDTAWLFNRIKNEYNVTKFFSRICKGIQRK